MQGISGFFDKFKNTALRELNKREVIISSIFSTTKQKIDIKDINIKEGIVVIKGNQSLKSEIFLKKKLILDQINKKGIKISDIK
mgnify:CR=1 FL=1